MLFLSFSSEIQLKWREIILKYQFLQITKCLLKISTSHSLNLVNYPIFAA